MVQYNDRISGRFLQATVGWGLLALFLGFYAAFELKFGSGQSQKAFLSFGRLRPLHANLMVFAFAANAIFAGVYHSVQRLCQTRIWSDHLAQIHFWAWQIIQLTGLVTVALGYTQGRPLAEFEWPLDIALLLIWGLFSLNLFMTLHRRRTPFLYVALWFYIAATVGFGLIFTVNALAWPAGPGKSYPLFVGVADAMIQAWYGQGVNSFLLTLPCLGLMYYFLPKIVKKPLHSYPLAILQFWALVLFSVWTAGARLHSTSLPEWMQSLGLVFCLLLLAPGWAAVINGLLTIGRDDIKVWRNPAVLFFGLGLASFGVYVLFEALLAFKSIHIVVQYTDVISAQTHLMMMGWVGSMICGMAYILVPKLWQHPLYSRNLGRIHFAISLLSLVLMVLALGISGVKQGWSWLAMQDNGLLVYPEFISTVRPLKSLHTLRLVSAGLFLGGSLLALYNFFQTARRGQLQDASKPVEELILPEPQNRWERLERRPEALALAVVALMIISSLIQLLPLPSPQTDLKPYTPLAQYGRDVYIREGCHSCHTQVVRMALKEELRFGPASQGWEYQQDRPALWGQRRYGPDLHRIGGRYPHLWHYQHLITPQTMTSGTPMPAYPWLLKKRVNFKALAIRHATLRKLGVRYGNEDPVLLYQEEAKKIQENLAQAQITVEAEADLIALIAYLQKLGVVDGKQ
ncbi:cbb3-type cytochrome c oxidase subunit I [Oligoflexus tunisiensis]|uniref:cbb3-type cytochrome c oxidase subunit I n=1 Tax=Oligoflexus tunisiensis TaxID=708132 RepID=UPI000A5319D5|nr:cbb3-type cytochrome c oxidase subunit I [Oligoflexus tunisiensis]